MDVSSLSPYWWAAGAALFIGALMLVRWHQRWTRLREIAMVQLADKDRRIAALERFHSTDKGFKITILAYEDGLDIKFGEEEINAWGRWYHNDGFVDLGVMIETKLRELGYQNIVVEECY